MAYTFAGANTDRIEQSLGVTLHSDNDAQLFAGWFYPTGLTAGNRYWSQGATSGAEIDATTSEIRMKTDHNTTDGEFVTSGAGITVDKWWFIAWAHSLESGGGPTNAYRVWVGDAETPPTEVTVTVAVTRSGTLVSSNNITIANTSGGSVSWAGLVGAFAYLNLSDLAGRIGWFNNAATGSLSNDEAAFLLQRYVTPMWAGNVPVKLFASGGVFHYGISFDLSVQPVVGIRVAGSNSLSAIVQPTITGTSWSAENPPRQMPTNWQLEYPSPRTYARV